MLFDCEGYAISESFYRIEIERLVFKLCLVLLGSHFPSRALAAHLGGKVNHLKWLNDNRCPFHNNKSLPWLQNVYEMHINT